MYVSNRLTLTEFAHLPNLIYDASCNTIQRRNDFCCEKSATYCHIRSVVTRLVILTPGFDSQTSQVKLGAPNRSQLN